MHQNIIGRHHYLLDSMQCVVTVDSHNEIEILKRRSTRHNNTFKPAMYVV